MYENQTRQARGVAAVNLPMENIRLRGYNYFFEDLNSLKQETILLVHGHPFEHTMWRYQYDTLNNFRLILPDLKGYGKNRLQF
jgi:pimeloyl-ACP methyl ester carboxylesterase